MTELRTKFLFYFIALIFNLQSHGQEPAIDSLNFNELKERLGSSVIIGLGEVGHGYETINETKSAFVKLIQRKENSDALAFESSFVGSTMSFIRQSGSDSRLNNFLYPFWNTDTVKALLKTFINQETTLKPLVIGFDIQEDCRYTLLSSVLIEKKIISENKDLLLQCDSVLSKYIGENSTGKHALSRDEYLSLIRNYDILMSEVTRRQIDYLQRKMLERCIQNRKWLCSYLTISRLQEKMYFRDSLMAENIKWMQRELYSANRLIVWASDTHIAKNTNLNRAPRWMGEWLSRWYGKDYFSISFQKGSKGEKFPSTKTSFNYPEKGSRFDLIINSDKLKRINNKHWIRPCR